MDFFKILCIQVTFVLQFVFHQHLKTIECHNLNKMKLVRPKKGVCLLAYFRVTVKMLCFLASSLTQSVSQVLQWSLAHISYSFAFCQYSDDACTTREKQKNLKTLGLSMERNMQHAAGSFMMLGFASSSSSSWGQQRIFS